MRETRSYGSVRGVPRDSGVSTATPLSPTDRDSPNARPNFEFLGTCPRPPPEEADRRSRRRIPRGPFRLRIERPPAPHIPARTRHGSSSVAGSHAPSTSATSRQRPGSSSTSTSFSASPSAERTCRPVGFAVISRGTDAMGAGIDVRAASSAADGLASAPSTEFVVTAAGACELQDDPERCW